MTTIVIGPSKVVFEPKYNKVWLEIDDAKYDEIKKLEQKRMRAFQAPSNYARTELVVSTVNWPHRVAVKMRTGFRVPARGEVIKVHCEMSEVPWIYKNRYGVSLLVKHCEYQSD